MASTTAVLCFTLLYAVANGSGINNEEFVIEESGAVEGSGAVTGSAVSSLCRNYHFRYDKQNDWKKKCYDCGHAWQSPININKGKVNFGNRYVKPLILEGFHIERKGNWRNFNGHTAKFIPYVTERPAYLDIKYFRSTDSRYKFKEFHFHWGRYNNKGSEHTVNGGSYSGEMHLVFTGKRYKVTYYSVIAVFLQAHNVRNMDRKWRKLYNNIPYGYNQINRATGIKLSSYLPLNKDYYMYSGSLTTPPCTERVLWFVMKTPISVPQQFLESLRRIKADHNTNRRLTTNHRYTQPFNNRPRVLSCYNGC